MVAGAVVFLIGLAGAKCVPVVAWALQAPPVSQQSQAFDDFTRRVQQYVKLHNSGAVRFRASRRPAPRAKELGYQLMPTTT